LEVWLIGRDDNFIGQILMVLKNKEGKRKMFSKIKLRMNRDAVKVQGVE